MTYHIIKRSVKLDEMILRGAACFFSSPRAAEFDFVRDTYRICFKDIGCDHFTEDALAPNVPHLHGDLDIVGQFQATNEEV